MRARQLIYDRMLRHYRREEDGRAEQIDVGDFELRSDGLEAALDLCAVCRSPIPA